MKNATITFSERNGYIISKSVLIREKLTPELITSICNDLELLKKKYGLFYYNLEQYMWCKTFNKRFNEFGNPTKGYKSVSIEYIEDTNNQWYEKMDYIEKIIDFAQKADKDIYVWLTEQLNSDFRNLHFAYRIVAGQIIEISSIEEDEENDQLTSSTQIPLKDVKGQLKNIMSFLFLLH
ncbi:AbiJ-NTD4 domain-containing protein [uncultured Bacteroides sp.]|uniref:AbiJ-NTD4 domain-containing protein n=1 Tax=uncultured Bacteroides sp. TaxID=162156 RepID=UPI002AAC1EA3|nr:hypothetical protein [uncultured Bacteroides sp.]